MDLNTVGYARRSLRDDSVSEQLKKLRHCKKIYKERGRGPNSTLPSLQECLTYVRKGDILVVTRLDRLARSTRHLCQIAETLKQKEVELRVLDQEIDTSTPAGRLFFSMLSSLSQFEVDMRRERQKEGIQKAKKKGVRFGLAKKLSDKEHRELIEKRRTGLLIADLRKIYNLSHKSVYNYLHREPK